MIGACAVVPVFDNASTVGDVALAAAAYVDLVIVVDDGSRDGSGDAARSAAARAPAGRTIEVVSLPANRGKGQALVAGFRRARELGRTHAVTVDADGQHRASDIPALVAAAQARPLAVVVGARDMDSDRIPNSARVGRRISNFWTLRSTGFDLPDTTCGLRVYPVREVLDLPIRTRHYDFEGEVLVRAAWAGLDLASVPVDVWYPEDKAARVSHFRIWTDSFLITVMYVRLALRRLLPTGAASRAVPGVTAPKMRVRDVRRHVREMWASGTHSNELALAVGIGVFIGATPLWMLQTILALYIAARWRLNAVAAFLGTNVSFYPFIPALVFAEVQFGHLLRRGEWLDLSFGDITTDNAWSHATDYVVGGFALAALMGISVGLFILKFGDALRRRKPA